MFRFLFFGVVLVVLACERKVESTNTSDNTSVADEVMAIHDSVMPKMGDLRKTRKALLDQAENETDSMVLVALLGKANQLDSAQKAMMGWMRQYNPTYYEDQKKMIQEVKDLMESALSEGKDLLK